MEYPACTGSRQPFTQIGSACRRSAGLPCMPPPTTTGAGLQIRPSARHLGEPEAMRRGCGLDPGLDVQLGDDMGDMDARRLRADVERGADLRVRAAVGQQVQDVELAGGKAETLGD